MTSELSAPLARRGARAGKATGGTFSWRRLPIARLAFSGIALLIVAVIGRVILVDTPDGGWPFAEVDINVNQSGNLVAGTTGSATIEVGPEMPVGDANSIITLGDATMHGGSIDSLDAATVAMIPNRETGIIPDLSEETEHGPIPRMSATGERPFDLYARPSMIAGGGASKPMVAIIVTGLGINAASSKEAAAALPGEVTMAFAPYGDKLVETAGVAREYGHELFLEVPLEPFDYPDNDPGPDTLLAGRAPRENIDKLFSVMGSFGGYVGVINNMGARFTSSGADFGPIIEELGARGLGYLDDGSSNRSLAEQLAAANRVPFAKAHLTIDANPTPAAILAQLTALEQRALSDGQAIGVISALPVSIKTLAEWAETVDSRGLLLVPASALMK